ncbi:hypothetical protein C3L33_17626, partial [Rhododendron williamsianum]
MLLNFLVIFSTGITSFSIQPLYSPGRYQIQSWHKGHHRDTMVAEQSTGKPEDRGHDFFLNYANRGKLRSLDLSATAFWRVLDPPLDACRYFLIESGFALLVAFFINVAVISVTATICSAEDLSEQCNDITLNSASFLLKV